jgi:hypothetical protein
LVVASSSNVVEAVGVVLEVLGELVCWKNMGG